MNFCSSWWSLGNTPDLLPLELSPVKHTTLGPMCMSYWDHYKTLQSLLIQPFLHWYVSHWSWDALSITPTNMQRRQPVSPTENKRSHSTQSMGKVLPSPPFYCFLNDNKITSLSSTVFNHHQLSIIVIRSPMHHIQSISSFIKFPIVLGCNWF